MTDLLAARTQMAMSLAFHIVFAAIGVGLPLLMLISEGLWLRTRKRVYLELTKAWAKGLAIFFAVGAVSGTVLSFELGLLWPQFMEVAGPLIGMPFSLEGFAFFTEAIFLGIYLYGWNRVSEKAHLFAGGMVALSGAASAFFVLSVNGWMNAPTGFILGEDGSFQGIDPIAAMWNPFWIANAIHMILACYVATSFGAATIHAWQLLKDPDSLFHRAALGIALSLGAATALLQPISGDFSATVVAELQPAKLAAMEAHWETGACAPLHIGGWPDMEAERMRGALAIPCGLSLLVGKNPNTVVTGLEDIPREEWPNVPIVRTSFQVMVGIGFFLVALSLWFMWMRWKRIEPAGQRLFLMALVVAGPLAFLAIQAGWIVTEVGRQPWIIYGIMRTDEAVTAMQGLQVPLVTFTLLYLLLSFIVVYLVRRQVRAAPRFGVLGSGEPDA